jgi:hypothetical protein
MRRRREFGNVALINQAMQRRYWPDKNGIGETIVLNHGVTTQNVWTLAAPGSESTS